MEAKSHWIIDNFFPEAPQMRKKIEDHFNDTLAKQGPFSKRTIWNYWYIDELYIYLRTEPQNLFPVLFKLFMEQLSDFVGREFGLATTSGLLSMYINGCGQGMHNDSKNGRLAYVFSLTKWENKRFDGGETLIYKVDESSLQNARFLPSAGEAFYHRVDSLFNRLLIFDDRMPHAVRPVQGTMNPLDARFVIHGHIEEPHRIAHVEGGLQHTDLQMPWQQIDAAVSDMLRSHGQHGFITFELAVDPSGDTIGRLVKHTQLHPLSPQSKSISQCVEDAIDIISRVVWPAATSSSRMVFAVTSGALHS